MELHVTPEPGAKLAHTAARQGRNTNEPAQEVLTQFSRTKAFFAEAVKRGEAALDRGEYLTQEQVTQRLQRFLKP